MNYDVIMRNVEIIRVAGSPPRDVTGVVADSRQVKPGSVFVAIAGTRKDGSSYIADAVARGASIIVSEQLEQNSFPAGGNTCCLQVADAREAIAILSSNFYDRPSVKLRMVGITGTNGKTTTAYLVRQILGDAGMKPGLISTVAYEFGARSIPADRTTPDAVALHGLLSKMVNAGCLSAVMEVSSHGLLQKRVSGIDFDVGVFTNLTHDHLDYHGTMDNYFMAKSRLFRQLRGSDQGNKPAIAVINIDNLWGRKIIQDNLTSAKIVTYGMDPEAEVCGIGPDISSRGTQFIVRSPWGETQINSNLMGRFNVSNILAAVATCSSLGIDLSAIRSSIAAMKTVRGRLERVEEIKDRCVFVDYAHTDDA
ncbi:MAG: UDP-N-acetylmuramoyl-L-alanyl-D-glutamate--2,6-diaminopimelate ligase, partial [Lentisphaerae bacterium]|nr:UDP-N-acetylmuramoyl-L-alanyl-D-glutamate--2,6-diaminopimelate ligase [Lentisphaerota bacterium]